MSPQVADRSGPEEGTGLPGCLSADVERVVPRAPRPGRDQGAGAFHPTVVRGNASEVLAMIDRIEMPTILEYSQALAQLKAGGIMTYSSGTSAIRPEDVLPMRQRGAPDWSTLRENWTYTESLPQ